MSHPPPPAFRREEEESSDDEPHPERLHDDNLAELFKFPDGVAVRFFLHDSLTAGMKAQATEKIEAYGGQTTLREKHANVILVSESRLSMPLKRMQLRYDAHSNPAMRNIHVEPLGFLTRCANMGRFKLGGEKRIKSGMPGRPPGYAYRQCVFTTLPSTQTCLKSLASYDTGQSGSLLKMIIISVDTWLFESLTKWQADGRETTFTWISGIWFASCIWIILLC